MLVKVNGQKVELPDGSTIQDAIKATNAPYHEGCVLAVIKGKEEFEKHINKYKIKTNKGSVIIEMVEDESAAELVKIWKETKRRIYSFQSYGTL